jgi:hypothetical protein
MSDNLLLTGGPGAHDFEATSGEVTRLLRECGVKSEVSGDVNASLEMLGRSPASLVTLNMMFCYHHGARLKGSTGVPSALSAQARRALKAHLRGGGGLLALHTASICFDDWPEWRDILGGTWNWSVSRHPPLGEATVRVADPSSPLTRGLSDFVTVDEIYGFLDLEPDVRPLLVSTHGGADHPVLWTRQWKAGRVVYLALGHDTRAYHVQEHAEILRRAARWASGADDVPPAGAS